MRTLATKVVHLPPVMHNFNAELISAEATEITDTAELARLKASLLLKQGELPSNITVSVADFTIVKAYMMPGVTPQMLSTRIKLLFKCVPGELKAPTGASSPFILRALTFVKGPKRPVKVNDAGNMWIMNRPAGVNPNPASQPGNESDVYANSYNPLALLIVKITAVK